MAVEQLATELDVESALGRGLTSDESGRVEAILDKASELFREVSGQTFTPARSEVRVKVNGGRAFLRQKPVTEVHSVTDDHGRPIFYTRVGRWLHVPMGSHEFVNVDYSHGGDVPDLVRLTVADVARQVLSIDPAAATGVSQFSETTGPFTDQFTYASWALGGATRLSPEDQTIARRFRTSIPNVWIS